MELLTQDGVNSEKVEIDYTIIHSLLHSTIRIERCRSTANS